MPKSKTKASKFAPADVSVVDVEPSTGEPVDPINHRVPDKPLIPKDKARRYERIVSDLAFPAQLPTPQRRLLAQRLYELTVQHDTESQRLYQTCISVHTRVPFAELDPKIQAALRRHANARARLTMIEAELQNLNVHIYDYNTFDSTLLVKRPEADVTAEKAALERQKQEHFAHKQRTIDEFKRLVQDIAADALAKLKAALPKDLVARIETVGTKQLPATTETPS